MNLQNLWRKLVSKLAMIAILVLAHFGLAWINVQQHYLRVKCAIYWPLRLRALLALVQVPATSWVNTRSDRRSKQRHYNPNSLLEPALGTLWVRTAPRLEQQRAEFGAVVTWIPWPLLRAVQDAKWRGLRPLIIATALTAPWQGPQYQQSMRKGQCANV